MTRQQPVALTIAGSDPTGGAGVQADLKTFAAHNVHGASVIATLTAQNATRFELAPVAAALIKAQIDAVFEAFEVRAVKIGMLSGADSVRAVIEALAPRLEKNAPPLILDPVMRASNDGRALDDAGFTLMRDKLIPLCALIKPNLFEAARLLGDRQARSLEEMRKQARDLLSSGCGHVYLSAGHLATGDEAVDILAGADGVVELPGERLAGVDVHGGGCTLTAAITAALANGANMTQACQQAKSYMAQLFASAPQLDRGGRPISFHHLAPPSPKAS